MVGQLGWQIEVSWDCFHQHVYAYMNKAQKRQASHQCLFALLGLAGEKAARKILVKSNPGKLLKHATALRKTHA